jgi:polyisoprenoid-binding protein YceI
MAARYTLDPSQGRFTVQAFATGLLSALGHSPTFAVRDFSGGIHFERDEIRSMRLDLTVRADSLDLLDRVKDADRREIIDRMRRDVLESSTYPEIAYHSDDVSSEPIAPGRFRVRIGGHLALHGASRPHRVDAEIQVFGDGIRLLGETPLKLSDYGIRPVTALAGAIKLKDDLKVSFDLPGRPEESR